MTIGEKIKALREEKGVSLRTLAFTMGKDPAQLSRWENGVAIPSIYSLRAIAFALEVDVNELIDLL